MHRMGEAHMAHLVAVHNPRHVVRRPLHLVYMPVIPGVESLGLVVRLHLALMALAINQVHLEWIVFKRRHNLKVKLVPAIGRKVLAGEEGGNGAFAVRGLHTRHELAVLELLVRGDRAAAEVRSLGHPNHH